MDHGPTSFVQTTAPLESTEVFAPDRGELNDDLRGKVWVWTALCVIVATVGLWKWVETGHGSGMMILLGRTLAIAGVMGIAAGWTLYFVLNKTAQAADMPKRVIEFYRDGLVVSAEAGGQFTCSFRLLRNLRVEATRMVMEFEDGEVEVPVYAFKDRGKFERAAKIVQDILDSRLRSLRAG